MMSAMRACGDIAALAGLWLTCLLALPAHADTRAWLDRDDVTLGETATLNIETLQAGVDAPDYAPLEADFSVSQRSSRRSVEWREGTRQTRALFAVALTPRRTGVFSVPSLQVGAQRTRPLALTVVASAAPVPAPARAGEAVFIEAEADSRVVYVQQSVGYVLRLHYARPLVSGELEQPLPDGTSMQRIGSDVRYTRGIGGQQYTVVERRYLLVPERSGPLTIPAARFRGRGVGGFFDDWGGSARELRADGQAQTLQVRAMPVDAPQPWLPLRGLSLRYVDTPQQVRAGEAAEVTLEVMADGATGDQLPELKLPWIQGARVFAEPQQVDERFDGGQLHTRVMRRFSVVPAQAGSLRLPGPRLAWWDVRAGVAREASLPDLQWQVLAAVDVDAAALPPASTPAGQVSADVTGAGRHGRDGWRLLALLFAVLWLVTLVLLAWQRRHVWLRRGGALQGDAEAGVSNAVPQPVLRMPPRRLRQLLQTAAPEDVTAALCALASPPARDLETLRAMLGDPAQCEAIDDLQRARWGDGDVAAARAALRTAFADGPKWRKAAARASDLLPPLYAGRLRD